MPSDIGKMAIVVRGVFEGLRGRIYSEESHDGEMMVWIILTEKAYALAEKKSEDFYRTDRALYIWKSTRTGEAGILVKKRDVEVLGA